MDGPLLTIPPTWIRKMAIQQHLDRSLDTSAVLTRVICLSLMLSSVGLAQQPVNMTVINTTREPVQLLWVDDQNQEIDYGTILPGERVDQQSYVGHAWRFKSSGRLLGTYVMTAAARQKLDLGKLTSGTPGNPAPGVGQQRNRWDGALEMASGRGPMISFRRLAGQQWAQYDAGGKQIAGPYVSTTEPDGTVMLHDSPGSLSGIHILGDTAQILKDGGNGQVYSTSYYRGKWVSGGTRPGAAPAAQTRWTGFLGSPPSPSPPPVEFRRLADGKWGHFAGRNLQQAATIVRFNQSGEIREVSLANGRWVNQ